jgi:hypothetical protein
MDVRCEGGKLYVYHRTVTLRIEHGGLTREEGSWAVSHQAGCCCCENCSGSSSGWSSSSVWISSSSLVLSSSWVHPPSSSDVPLAVEQFEFDLGDRPAAVEQPGRHRPVVLPRAAVQQRRDRSPAQQRQRLVAEQFVVDRQFVQQQQLVGTAAELVRRAEQFARGPTTDREQLHHFVLTGGSMRVFLAGYPGEMGGANTEAWHTVKLWRRAGLDVHLIPTWGFDDRWRARLDALGCVTHPTRPDDLERVPGLAGSPVVAFCNGEFLTHAHRFRALGCPLVWANCMTFLFDHEKKAFADHGPADAFVFQSEFQRKQLEPQLAPLGYDRTTGHLIRGAFDLDEWEFRPRPHGKHEPFVVGRVARPDADKWSSNT